MQIINMAKNNNLSDFLSDIADAIREKKGSSEPINAQDFSSEIASIETGGSGTRYTGHADVEGLRAIGWTDEDIAYYQENGVNWNEEEDEYHKVTDGNKALYGVLTVNNIQTYKDRIVYLPKIDISTTLMRNMFASCKALVAIPLLNTKNVTTMAGLFSGCNSLVCVSPLDTSSVTDMNTMFNACYSLVSIPQLNTSEVKNAASMFADCRSLASIPQLDTSKATNMSYMFYRCYSLESIPPLNTSAATNISRIFAECNALTYIPSLNTSSATNMSGMFYRCYSLASISQFDMVNVTNASSMFGECSSLVHININNVASELAFDGSSLLSKESLLYLINNEATTSAITIKLTTYAYERFANDVDVVAALTNHPNISLASA